MTAGADPTALARGACLQAETPKVPRWGLEKAGVRVSRRSDCRKKKGAVAPSEPVALVIPAGIEPAAYGLGNRRSIRLSYGTVVEGAGYYCGSEARKRDCPRTLQALLERSSECCLKLVHAVGLLQLSHSSIIDFYGKVATAHDDRMFGGEGSQLGEYLLAGYAGHGLVEDRDFDALPRAQELERLLATIRSQNTVSQYLKQLRHHLQNNGLVVHK